MVAVPEWLVTLGHHLVEAPVKIVQAFTRAFPKTDHYRFNVVVDVIAAIVFLICLTQIPKEHKAWAAAGGPLILLFFFSWCYKTALTTKRR
jgi:hypothetical protein